MIENTLCENTFIAVVLQRLTILTLFSAVKVFTDIKTFVVTIKLQNL